MTYLALFAALGGPVAEPIPLASRVNDLVADYKGKVAVAFLHLDTREKFELHADDVMPTASLIKLAVMAEAYAQGKEGRVRLDEMLTLPKEEMVQGSGIL